MTLLYAHTVQCVPGFFSLQYLSVVKNTHVQYQCVLVAEHSLSMQSCLIMVTLISSDPLISVSCFWNVNSVSQAGSQLYLSNDWSPKYHRSLWPSCPALHRLTKWDQDKFPASTMYLTAEQLNALNDITDYFSSGVCVRVLDASLQVWGWTATVVLLGFNN